MPTFTMRDPKGKPLGDPVEYTPVHVSIGGHRRELALHKRCSEWQVSDPVTGGRICEVHGMWRGIRVSSSEVKPPEAKRLAREQVEQLAAKVGADRFNARLDEAAKKFAIA